VQEKKTFLIGDHKNATSPANAAAVSMRDELPDESPDALRTVDELLPLVAVTVPASDVPAPEADEEVAVAVVPGAVDASVVDARVVVAAVVAAVAVVIVRVVVAAVAVVVTGTLDVAKQ
jgi:hypothetical protein